MLYYFNSTNSSSGVKMGKMLCDIVSKNILPNQEIIILCIGSDRSTGDSLGPLIGHQFRDYISPGMYLIGDLNQPVHAANLNYCLKTISKTFDNPYIIAIDASLGKEDHVGYMTLATGPLKPGLGVKKKLPEVGDIHITGIVNSSRDMEFSTLQTTRLSIIFQIADAIVLALRTFNDDYYIQQEPALSYLLRQTS
ncbi:spore protease YyaC [Lachnospira eligens]|jgi:putative sporulation protein YyaC|uniref:spore protease YyaC n=1 Tax=Lachnospira eligens TaxID=39485 RepID=UPI0002DF46CC|nr:spore protease YyaC [Lachnospira eligens]UEA98026.1 spore protease YyaC [Lachnospira eligens]